MVADVAGGAPTVAAHVSTPFPDVGIAVLAEAEEDVARLFFESFVHHTVRLLVIRQKQGRSIPTALAGRVGSVCALGNGVGAEAGGGFLIGDVAVTAPVVFQIIKTPVGVLPGIDRK